MGTDKVSSVCGATDSYCSLPSLSGGGKLKYPPKVTTQQPTRSRVLQEPLASLPVHGRHHAQWRSETRHVTSKSVPIHSADRRDDDRGSNSAPTETDRHHTNHDRQALVHVPRLPKINNLVKDPLQQQIHGTSTATEAGRRDTGGRRWASSWADARANSSSVGEKKNGADNCIHQPNWEIHQQSPDKLGQTKEVHKTPSPIKSISPRIPSNAMVKSSEITAQKVPVKQSEVTKNEAQETKTIRNGSVVQGKGDNVRESRLKPDRRTQSTSQIETKPSKPSPTRSKSSAVLTNRQEITSQNSQTLPAKLSPSTSSASPRRDISQVGTVSQGSHSTTTSLQSKQPSRKKRFRKPVIITRKSLIKQKTLQSVYGNRTYKYQRQIRVLQKMEEIQKKEVEEFNRELKAKEKQRMESIIKQRMALKRVRDKFDEEQVRRFSRQYVSWKSVEEDRLKHSSEQYGLPDFIYEDRYEKTLKKVQESPTEETAAGLVPGKKSPKKFQKYAAWVRNIKMFEKLLNPKVGGNLEQTFKSNRKTIVEGIDTVKLDSDDSEATQKVNVKRLIGSAKKLLTVTETSDDISELSTFRDDDDDSSLVLSDDDNDQ